MNQMMAMGGGAAALRGRFSILTITDGSATRILITTATPHGLSGGENIVISGTGTYDGAATVFSVVSATTFKSASFSYSVPTSGGAWRFA